MSSGIFENMSEQTKFRFIAGRRSRALRRRISAEERRCRLAELFRCVDISVRGWQGKLAKELGIHTTTVKRDLQILALEQIDFQLGQFENELNFRQRFLRQIENVNARHETKQLRQKNTIEQAKK